MKLCKIEPTFPWLLPVFSSELNLLAFCVRDSHVQIRSTSGQSENGFYIKRRFKLPTITSKQQRCWSSYQDCQIQCELGQGLKNNRFQISTYIYECLFQINERMQNLARFKKLALNTFSFFHIARIHVSQGTLETVVEVGGWSEGKIGANNSTFQETNKFVR